MRYPNANNTRAVRNSNGNSWASLRFLLSVFSVRDTGLDMQPVEVEGKEYHRLFDGVTQDLVPTRNQFILVGSTDSVN